MSGPALLSRRCSALCLPDYSPVTVISLVQKYKPLPTPKPLHLLFPMPEILFLTFLMAGFFSSSFTYHLIHYLQRVGFLGHESTLRLCSFLLQRPLHFFQNGKTNLLFSCVFTCSFVHCPCPPVAHVRREAMACSP